jgi:hypothetical protein
MVTVPYGQSAVMTLSLNSSSTTPSSYPGAALEFFDFRVIDKAVFEPLNTSGHQRKIAVRRFRRHESYFYVARVKRTRA